MTERSSASASEGHRIVPAVLDTTAFAPLPAEQRERAARTRPGVELVATSTGVVRVRQAGRGGLPVVLLPDAPNTVEHYDDMVALLQDGHTVVVLEMPGFGHSWADDPAALTFDGTVDACIEVIEGLRLGAAVLAATCVQAHVVLAIATRRPDLARALVLGQAASWVDTAVWVDRVLDPGGRLRTPWAGQALWRMVRERAAVETWYPMAAPPGRDVRGWQATARAALRDGSAYSLATLLQEWLGGAPPALGPVTTRTTLIWGAADLTHARAGSGPAGLLEVAPGASVDIWDDAGHFPDLEQPQRWIAAIRRLG